MPHSSVLRLAAMVAFASLSACNCQRRAAIETPIAELQSCREDERCETGLCDSASGADKTCLRPCTMGCRGSDICTQLPGGRYACVPEKAGLCKACTKDSDCPITTVVLGIVAVVLGIAFEKQNIAFMVSLAFAIAASANFPVLLMSVLWKGCTTRGAVIGGFVGLASSVALTVVSPAVWEATLGNPKGSALFPYTSPALFSMTLAFVSIWLFSILDKSQRASVDRGGFLAQQVRSETGIGAAGASGH